MESDQALDIRDAFLFHFEHNIEVETIRKILTQQFKAEIRESSYLFWLPLAYTEWEYGALEEVVHNKAKALVEDLVENGYSVSEEGSDVGAAHQLAAFVKLVETISRHNSCPKKANYAKRVDPEYKIGDCVAFRYSTGLWGGIYIVSTGKTPRYVDMGRNGFYQLDILSVNKPSMGDFKKAKVVPLQFIFENCAPKEIAHIFGFDFQNHNRDRHFTLIGKLHCGSSLKSKKAAYLDKYLPKLEEYIADIAKKDRRLDTLAKRRSPLFNEPRPLDLLIFFAAMALLVVLLNLIVS